MLGFEATTTLSEALDEIIPWIRPADRDRGDLMATAPLPALSIEGGLGPALRAPLLTRAERAAKARLWRTLCEAFFRRYVPADGTVLDVGAGYCDFINHVRARAAASPWT